MTDDFYTNRLVRIINNDCRSVLQRLPDSSIDLFMTSPPYADARASTYGGIHLDEYNTWFLPIAAEIFRVLTPSGSFVLNIKERLQNGERHTYVLDLILKMKQETGWRWTEEFIWHKRNAMPGNYGKHLKDGYERCLHFTKTADYIFNKEAVRIPPTWTKDSKRNPGRQNSGNLSGFGVNRLKMKDDIGQDVLPSNVLHLSGECHNKNHPAVFPIELPVFFIKLLSNEGETVCDPFLGSGTTGVAAVKYGRRFVGIDTSTDYCQTAVRRIRKESFTPLLLPE